MRIAIDSRVANDPAVHQFLDRIMHKVYDGWHVWDTGDDPRTLETTAWIRDGRHWLRELLVRSTTRAAWSVRPHDRYLRVTALPAGANDLPPRTAARLVEEPLVILVENRDSDGAFLRRIVAAIDRSLHRLWNLDTAPIRFDSVGGGGQMASNVASRAQGLSYRPRLVAVIDSDKKCPDDTDSPNAQALRRTCEALGVAYWILAKREADNYLPRILLQARPNTGHDQGPLVEAWDRLNNDQKNFFDMKNGLPDSPPAGAQMLFRGLPEADRSILSSGFGHNVHECWSNWSVHHITRELTDRSQGDLEYGITIIRREV